MTSSSTTDPILARAAGGGRIPPEEAVALLRGADLVSLGRAADLACRRLHPEDFRTYSFDRNLNYTNVCWVDCKFCAFYRRPGDAESYVLPFEKIAEKIEELQRHGGTHILMQGGVHPTLPLPWYEDLLRAIKARFGIHIHAFSPPEIDYMARLNRLPLGEVLRRLKAAGLDSIPGGGAEVLVDRVRDRISPKKVKTAGWLAVMREAHRAGLKTTATMMFGHAETIEERVEHLDRIRALQDETGGFTAFIPWPLQPENTPMEGFPKASAHNYLRTLAVSRLYLDNIPNLQSSWLTVGAKIGQMALAYGANDMGSPVLEENVVSAAGAHHRMAKDEIRRAIAEMGFRPMRRDCLYTRAWDDN